MWQSSSIFVAVISLDLLCNQSEFKCALPDENQQWEKSPSHYISEEWRHRIGPAHVFYIMGSTVKISRCNPPISDGRYPPRE